MKTEPMTKSAMITICGRPNVGKSTLTNALVGEKIAIVSSKPQTTRNRITAIVSRGETQFVLMDTPGFHKPRTKLGDYMVNIVRESVADVDGVLLVVEPIPAIGPQEEALISRIEEQIRSRRRNCWRLWLFTAHGTALMKFSRFRRRREKGWRNCW